MVKPFSVELTGDKKDVYVFVSDVCNDVSRNI